MRTEIVPGHMDFYITISPHIFLFILHAELTVSSVEDAWISLLTRFVMLPISNWCIVYYTSSWETPKVSHIGKLKTTRWVVSWLNGFATSYTRTSWGPLIVLSEDRSMSRHQRCLGGPEGRLFQTDTKCPSLRMLDAKGSEVRTPMVSGRKFGVKTTENHWIWSKYWVIGAKLPVLEEKSWC